MRRPLSLPQRARVEALTSARFNSSHREQSGVGCKMAALCFSRSADLLCTPPLHYVRHRSFAPLQGSCAGLIYRLLFVCFGSEPDTQQSEKFMLPVPLPGHHWLGLVDSLPHSLGVAA